MPYVKSPRSVMIYLVGTMGYRVSLVVKMLLEEKAADFYEMMLHHVCAVALGVCAVYGNNIGGPSVISLIHDIPDIFVGLIKCGSTTDYEIPTLVVFAATILTWMWTRLYVLPQVILLGFTCTVDQRVSGFLRMQSLFLCPLQCLHFYWFYLFIRIIVHKVRTGKAEDLQDSKATKLD